MRACLLVLSLLLPLAGWGQFGEQVDFEDGYYVLAGGPGGRQLGFLKLKGSDLVVKTPAGQKLRLTPDQLASCRIGNLRYQVIRGQEMDLAEPGSEPAVLAEKLDSGRVELLGRNGQLDLPTTMGANGLIMGGGTATTCFFLVRTSPTGKYIPIRSNGGIGSGKRFREAIRPCFATRPDLLKRVDEKRITPENFQAAIHALNTGDPL